MVPKIIHYCWFGPNKMPSDFLQYINNWKRILPDYKFILWNEDNTSQIQSRFFKDALKLKKYAFAADYVRLYALLEYGGIYLDCDVEVIKSFDDLLELPYFIGKENTKYIVDSAVIGAEKGCEWIKDCLGYFNNEKNIVEHQFNKVLPSVLTDTLVRNNYSFNYIKDKASFINNDKTINLFPSYYFCPKNYSSKKIKLRPQSYCIHHFAGSWQSPLKRFMLLLWVPFSYRFPQISETIKGYLKFKMQ